MVAMSCDSRSACLQSLVLRVRVSEREREKGKGVSREDRKREGERVAMEECEARLQDSRQNSAVEFAAQNLLLQSSALLSFLCADLPVCLPPICACLPACLSVAACVPA